MSTALLAKPAPLNVDVAQGVSRLATSEARQLRTFDILLIPMLCQV